MIPDSEYDQTYTHPAQLIAEGFQFFDTHGQRCSSARGTSAIDRNGKAYKVYEVSKDALAAWGTVTMDNVIVVAL